MTHFRRLWKIFTLDVRVNYAFTAMEFESSVQLPLPIHFQLVTFELICSGAQGSAITRRVHWIPGQARNDSRRTCCVPAMTRMEAGSGCLKISRASSIHTWTV